MPVISSNGSPVSVLIAGIGGSSLGLEIFKSLRSAGGYRLVGTDISRRAFGLAVDGFDKTYVVEDVGASEYAARLLDICRQEGIQAVAPGAEATHRILHQHRDEFHQTNVLLMLNSPHVVDLCSDKAKCDAFLAGHGVRTPRSAPVLDASGVDAFDCFPCVVKPKSDSGGSNMVFLAQDRGEAGFFVDYLRKRGCLAVLQEYVDSQLEFTVGVVSDATGRVAGSIALRRSLDQKLSTMFRYRNQVLSSGWSQGLIEAFPEVCAQCERIATILGSTWALNIQGRLGADGTFYPFEVNPRHSGTTYLRTLAGFNDPHVLLQHHLRGAPLTFSPPRAGYYLRAFTETYIPPEGVST